VTVGKKKRWATRVESMRPSLIYVQQRAMFIFLEKERPNLVSGGR
jgi:hypothetical protein